jgi:RNA polymerase sigma-70 factor (ECF subfamily)
MLAIAPSTTPTDQELIEQTLEGRLEAYDQLMSRYQALIYKTAYGFGKSRENALDLSQSIFLKAYRKLGAFGGRSQFKTWLLRLAYNEGVNWLRANRRHREGHELLESAHLSLDKVSTAPEQEKNHLRTERQRLLLRGLERLNKRYRKALVLRYFHGLSVREVAGVLECTEGTAKNVLFRGVRSLRKELVRI